MKQDKIFELGRQATIWCCANLNPDTPKEEWDATWEQKFAESLIRECLSGLEQDRYAYADDCNWDTEYDEGFVDGIYRAETLIREIFGVK